MKTTIGLLVITIGLSLAIYLGGYVMLIGGIIQLIEAIKMDDVPAIAVAWGITRILLAGTAAVFTVYISIIIGILIIHK